MSVINRALILKLRHTKQDNLVSGTNIKTVNGTSILGSGDISTGIQGVTFAASATPPNSPTLGTIWFNTDKAKTYQWSEDSVGTRFWLEQGGAEFAIALPVLTETVINITSASTTTYSVNYYPSFIMVYQNGLKLKASDFTATNGTSITLNVSLTAGDVIEVVSLQT